MKKVDLGRVIGEMMERGNDKKSLAMFEYMEKNFHQVRNSSISMQEYFDKSRKIWERK